MLCAGRVPSRFNAFKKQFEEEDEEGDNDDGSNSKQMMECKKIQELRKELIRQCRRHMRSSNPKVALKRMSNEIKVEEEAHSQNYELLAVLLTYVAVLQLSLPFHPYLIPTSYQDISGNLDLIADFELEDEPSQSQSGATGGDDDDEDGPLVQSPKPCNENFADDDHCGSGNEISSDFVDENHAPEPALSYDSITVEETQMKSEFIAEEEESCLEYNTREMCTLEETVISDTSPTLEEATEEGLNVGTTTSSEQCTINLIVITTDQVDEQEESRSRKSLRSLLKCSKCAKTFTNHATLFSHIQQHDKEPLSNDSDSDEGSSDPEDNCDDEMDIDFKPEVEVEDKIEVKETETETPMDEGMDPQPSIRLELEKGSNSKANNMLRLPQITKGNYGTIRPVIKRKSTKMKKVEVLNAKKILQQKATRILERERKAKAKRVEKEAKQEARVRQAEAKKEAAKNRIFLSESELRKTLGGVSIQPVFKELRGPKRRLRFPPYKSPLAKLKEERIKLTCEICKELFPIKAMLQKHRIVTHNLKGYARCSSCFKLYPSHFHLVRHRTENKINKCYTANPHDFDLKPGAAPLFPFRKHSMGSKFCPHEGCYEVFQHKEYLSIHLKTHGKWSCTLCPVEFSKAHELAWHEINEHKTQSESASSSSSKTFQCTRCNNSCSGKQNIISHFLHSHMDIPRTDLYKKKCKICQKRFSPGDNVKIKEAHYRIHKVEGLKPSEYSTCSICSAPFITRNGLTIHMTMVHKQAPVYKCPASDCNKVFKKSDRLRAHMRDFHKNKVESGLTGAFECKICKELFVTEFNLKIHYKKCENENNEEQVFKCEKCESVFTKRKHLRNHVVNVHEPPKRVWPCDKCGKVFKTGTKLGQHSSYTHTDPSEWKFVCPEDGCGKRCWSRQKLTEHIRTHTNERPFICDFCGEAYRYRQYLRTHLAKVHGPSAAKALPTQPYIKPFDKTLKEQDLDENDDDDDDGANSGESSE